MQQRRDRLDDQPGDCEPDEWDRVLAVNARGAFLPRQPMGRLGLAEDVAHAVCYLASDDADFVTGTVLTIDGGLTAA